MRLGFVGTGTITAALVEGLVASGHDRPIILSPRNLQVVAGLTARFEQVEVAASNQAVLDRSDIVVLAVRPQIADEVLSGLAFRADHHVVSLIATVSLQHLRAATAPASEVTRAVPLPSAARRQGPIAVYPPHRAVLTLFDRLGTLIPVEDEGAFETLTAATAVMAGHFAMVDAIVQWMMRQGLADNTARTFIGALLEGLAGTATAQPERSFTRLAEEHQTAGGLNEQFLDLLRRAAVPRTIDQALDAVKTRLGRPRSA